MIFSIRHLTFLHCLFLLLSWSHPASADDQSRIQAGQQTYMMACFACHQPTGAGIPGMFPPLAGSDWVKSAKPDRLIRIVLHGMMGPVHINGELFRSPAPLMPAQGTMTDEQIANVLTYVRASWGNDAPSVSADEVRSIRRVEASRVTQWSEKELLEIALD